jgi:trimethylamine--corrinoid protein Co-methyltransferase
VKAVADRLLQLLTDEDLELIHEASLAILEETGIQFTLQEAQNIFRDAGLKVDQEGVVRFPAWAVEKALHNTPPRFTRYPLHPSYPAVEYGAGGLSFTSSSTPLYVLDSGSRRLRAATIRDTADFARLVDGLSNMSCANGGVWSREIPAPVFHAVYFELMVKNTAKPVPAGDILNRTIAEDLLRLAEIVAGGRGEIGRKKSFSLTACPEGKMRWGENILAFIEGAKAGMVLKITPMPFAGSTHPVTLAGLLAQTNAEILACVILIQLVCPGTAVLYTPYPGIMDMGAATHCFGTPEVALLGAAFAQLARRYRIPANIAVGTPDAKLADAQASYEKMMTALPAALAGADEIGLFGGMLGMADSVSFEQLVLDDEIAGNLRRITRGFEVSDRNLALQAIREVPFGGNFLEHEHTLQHFREEQFHSVLADRGTREAWERGGAKDALARAGERVRKILAEHEPPGLSSDTERELESEIRRICRREGAVYAPYRRRTAK